MADDPSCQTPMPELIEGLTQRLVALLSQVAEDVESADPRLICWSDDAHLYLEGTVPGSGSSIDLCVERGRFYVRVSR
jgi:hypothetical protein